MATVHSTGPYLVDCMQSTNWGPVHHTCRSKTANQRLELEDTSVTTASSCGVKLQEVLSGLEKGLNIEHTHAILQLFSTFTLLFILSTWGVITSKRKIMLT